MTIVADLYPHVVGIDTHARTHTYAVLHHGRLLDTATFPTHQAGLARAVDWIARRTDGDITTTLISAEGTSSYGARITTTLADHGYRVVEAPTPHRGHTGKTDALDAHAAARTVLTLDHTRLRDHRHHNTDRDAIAALTTLRDHYNQQRTVTINMLTALLRTHDLGIDARTPLTAHHITQIAAWRPHPSDPEHLAILRTIAINHARDILNYNQRLTTNHNQLEPLVTRHSPQLLDLFGVGVIGAAIIIQAWSHQGRIHSDAAFAMLAGAAPIPASSGNTQRHRLNRGGDRKLNRTLTQIVKTRLAHDPATKKYRDRRLAQGLTTRETIRCLKRYVARQIYRTLNNPPLDRA